MILARNRYHVLGIRRLLGRRVSVYEGTEIDHAYQFLLDVEKESGDPKAIALKVMNLIAPLGAGLDKARMAQIESILQPGGVVLGKKTVIKAVGDACEAIYASPDAWGACEAIDRLLRNTPAWLKLHLPTALRMLGRVRPHEDATPLEVLDSVVQARKRTGWIPRRCITTIHKSKGREADHVIVAHCGKSVFKNTREGRQLLYVAITRARQSLTFLVPEESRTLLLGN
jgi:DNA helicase-2/ATP-dependent DNA helicase PcrA